VLNLTNPMMMKGPLRDTWPVGPLKISIEVPDGKSVAQAKLLVAGQKVDVTVQDNRVTLDIAEIETMEVVHLVWG
jgi:hypothetical protein